MNPPCFSTGRSHLRSEKDSRNGHVKLWKSGSVEGGFFRTPLVISKFVNSPEAEKCWRGCGKVGDHTHIFWECPKIFTFWQGVKVEIMKILHIDLPFTPVFLA